MSSAEQACAPSSEENLSTVHLLPCTIDFDGPVPVNSFFQIKKAKNDLRSAFRGRELVGSVLTLPDGVQGVNAVQMKPSEKTETAWDCVGRFKEITVWQHDVAPDLGQLQDCIDWFEIADEVRHLITQSVRSHVVPIPFADVSLTISGFLCANCLNYLFSSTPSDFDADAQRRAAVQTARQRDVCAGYQAHRCDIDSEQKMLYVV
jgi:hypothetical protein